MSNTDQKKELEVFFDYVCPYCRRGIIEFMDMLPEFPDLRIKWVSCEAHPRPEFARVHSDLAIQALLFLEAQGGDLIKFNRLVYQAHFAERRRIDDVRVLAELAAVCGADPAALTAALTENRYAKQVEANNRLVWEELGLEAVPSYRYGDKIIGSGNGQLVSNDELRAFLKECGA